MFREIQCHGCPGVCYGWAGLELESEAHSRPHPRSAHRQACIQNGQRHHALLHWRRRGTELLSDRLRYKFPNFGEWCFVILHIASYWKNRVFPDWWWWGITPNVLGSRLGRKQIRNVCSSLFDTPDRIVNRLTLLNGAQKLTFALSFSFQFGIQSTSLIKFFGSFFLKTALSELWLIHNAFRLKERY